MHSKYSNMPLNPRIASRIPAVRQSSLSQINTQTFNPVIYLGDFNTSHQTPQYLSKIQAPQNSLLSTSQTIHINQPFPQFSSKPKILKTSVPEINVQYKYPFIYEPQSNSLKETFDLSNKKIQSPKLNETYYYSQTKLVHSNRNSEISPRPQRYSCLSESKNLDQPNERQIIQTNKFESAFASNNYNVLNHCSFGNVNKSSEKRVTGTLTSSMPTRVSIEPVRSSFPNKVQSLIELNSERDKMDLRKFQTLKFETKELKNANQYFNEEIKSSKGNYSYKSIETKIALGCNQKNNKIENRIFTFEDDSLKRDKMVRNSSPHVSSNIVFMSSNLSQKNQPNSDYFRSVQNTYDLFSQVKQNNYGPNEKSSTSKTKERLSLGLNEFYTPNNLKDNIQVKSNEGLLSLPPNSASHKKQNEYTRDRSRSKSILKKTTENNLKNTSVIKKCVRINEEKNTEQYFQKYLKKMYESMKTLPEAETRSLVIETSALFSKPVSLKEYQTMI